MAKKRILVINTFPIVNAQAGGQKRQAALVDAYQHAFAEVRYVGVFFKDYYKQYSEWDIPLPPELTPQVHAQPHLVDVTVGNAIFENALVKQKVTALLQEFQPDIIQIEQAFPYLGMKRLLAELGMHPKLIFSSHNVESPMKREILEGVHMPAAEINRVVQQIEDIELQLTRDSELVIACTKADQEYYDKHGARKSVVARNGMAPIKTTEAALQKWGTYFADRDIARKIVFVGSAHPPNWVGFTDMVGLAMGFVPFDSRVLLVGGICDYFQSTIKEAYNPAHTTFWQRVIACGKPDNEGLGALITLADVIILPITEGGGSNLKTAEAVLSGKAVVGTSHAFRSFEELMTLPNVYLADTPEAFRRAILTALHTPLQVRSAAQKKRADSVLWEHCLADAVQEVSKL